MARPAHPHAHALEVAHNRVLTAMYELLEAIRRAEAGYAWLVHDYENHVAEAERTRVRLRAAGYLLA